MKELDLKDLRYFRSVLEHCSIRRAAEKLDINPFALLKQIKTLEKSVDITLFERPPGSDDRVIPTEAAMALSEYELENRVQHARLARYFQKLRNAQRDTVRISMGEAYAQVFRDEVLNDFLHQYPDISVDLRIDSTDGVIADLIEETIHFGLAWNPPIDTRIDRHATMQQPILRLIAGKDHPLSRHPHRKITFSDISRHSMIALMPSEFAVRRMVKSLEISEKTQIKPALTVNSCGELTKFIKSGGASLVSVTSFRMSKEILSGEVSSIEIEADNPIIHHSKAHLLVRKEKRLPDIAEYLLSRAEKLSILQTSNPECIAAFQSK